MKRKKLLIRANILLLIWFFLDMIGVTFGNKVLVSRAWRDDGIFFVIYIVAIVWFLVKEKSGKFVLTTWLSIWFATQLYFHWYFTIFGPWEGKIRYFADAIKLIPSTTVYIPDLYHIVLHILILIALYSTMIYSVKSCKESV
ncbi:hypothetical protein KQI38_09670 [Tissierella carlieri]|jgi:hypothetical protein|uniref:hypothetical protein n=1 Tax=Tissierella carlieri TaxID=689904 RepID=UPI001C10CA89|nr:hypothetical protein [Tissierella carlieri]MBU5312296.1 hypothetical protein [Tissierella carlieri]